MPQRPISSYRAVSYMRLLVVELAGAFFLAALALLPFLFLKVLFSPAFYALLLSVLAASLLGSLLYWVRNGVRSVEVNESGFLVRRGRDGIPIHVAWAVVRDVRVRSSRVEIALSARPEGCRSARLAIRRDGFTTEDFKELGRQLALFRNRS